MSALQSLSDSAKQRENSDSKSRSAKFASALVALDCNIRIHPSNGCFAILQSCALQPMDSDRSGTVSLTKLERLFLLGHHSDTSILLTDRHITKSLISSKFKSNKAQSRPIRRIGSAIVFPVGEFRCTEKSTMTILT